MSHGLLVQVAYSRQKLVDRERPLTVAVRLSRLVPSVTRVCILARFRRIKKKERLLVVYTLENIEKADFELPWRPAIMADRRSSCYINPDPAIVISRQLLQEK